MSRKDLNAYIAFLLIFGGNSALGATVWDSSPVGQCTNKLDMSPHPETGVRIVKEKSPGKRGEKYVWFFDDTPSQNQIRSLYRVEKNKSCVILFLPYADTTDFKIANKMIPQTVTSFTHPMPNSDGAYEMTSVTYKFEPKTGYFEKYPSLCKKIVGTAAVEEIPCLEVFQ